MSRIRLGLMLATAIAFAAPAIAHAEMVEFKATLNGATEVPPTTSAGTGDALITLDTATKKISYTVTYIGLSGPATAGHIHGPALPGANAGVLIPFASPVSPVEGTATLTDEQVADMEAGKLYVNFHTAANKGGEIRGQIVKSK